MSSQSTTIKNSKLNMSPIPIVHTRTTSNPSLAGGNYRRHSEKKTSDEALSMPSTLLLIEPKDRFDVEEGFGVSAPQPQQVRAPPLLAHNAQFVKPYEPPPVETFNVSTETETQILFKKDIEGLKDYQGWMSNTVDPFIRDLRMALVQAKPDDINEFLYAYSLSLLSGSEPPVTTDREEYDRQQRKLNRSAGEGKSARK